MVTHLRNFLEEHGLYVTVVKYLFTIFLSVMSYRNHSDWGYILVTAVEVISIAAITNIFAKEQKLIAYLVNSVLVLIINIQNITMFPNFKLKLATHKKFTRRLVVQAFFRVIINPIFDKRDFFQSRFLGSFW